MSLICRVYTNPYILREYGLTYYHTVLTAVNGLLHIWKSIAYRLYIVNENKMSYHSLVFNLTLVYLEFLSEVFLEFVSPG